MKNRSLLAIGLGLVVAALVGGALSGAGWGRRGPAWMGNHMGRMGSHMGWAWSGSSARDEPAAPGAEEVIVRARDISFSPSTMRIEAGTTVNITLVNEGGLPHNLTIADLDFLLVAGPGARISSAITPEEPGEYAFECTVPGHVEAGMVGTLVVTEG